MHFTIENELIAKLKFSKNTTPIYVVGVDEVGYGALAGPVVAAAVSFAQNHHIDEINNQINDSKKLSYKKRSLLFDKIIKYASYAIGFADVNEIDQYNVLQATHLAMQRSLSKLNISIDYVLIDGNKLPKLSWPAKALINGDNISISIAAASIIAKVTRDRFMEKIHNQYPQYFWESNKGYGTKKHLNSLNIYGVSPYHRLSFSPVSQALKY